MNMLLGQKEVGIAQRLYQCRDQAVFLRGEDGFIKEVSKWKPLFDEIISSNGCSEIEALTELLQCAKGKPDEGLLMHVLTAVGCELAEPKYTNKG